MPSNKPLTSADLDNFLKGFKGGLDKLAEQLGHVGALGTTPMFSEQAARVRHERTISEKDFEEAEENLRLIEKESEILDEQANIQNKICKIISDITEARRKLNDAIMTGDAAEEQAQKEIIAQLKQKEGKGRQNNDDRCRNAVTGVVCGPVYHASLFCFSRTSFGDNIRNVDYYSGGMYPAADLFWLYSPDLPDEGYSENVYVSRRRAQVHQLYRTWTGVECGECFEKFTRA